MRPIHQDEEADYRQQEAEEHYERKQRRKCQDEWLRAKRDPSYTPSWEDER